MNSWPKLLDSLKDALNASSISELHQSSLSSFRKRFGSAIGSSNNNDFFNPSLFILKFEKTAFIGRDACSTIAHNICALFIFLCLCLLPISIADSITFLTLGTRLYFSISIFYTISIQTISYKSSHPK